MNNQDQIDFKELKKELKDIEPLSVSNLDVKSWESDIQWWIKLQSITSPRKIFIACVLTSRGEPRKIIQELQQRNYAAGESEDESEVESDSDDESSSESSSEYYPSLKTIVKADLNPTS